MVNVHALNYPDVKTSLFLTVNQVAEQTELVRGQAPMILSTKDMKAMVILKYIS